MPNDRTLRFHNAFVTALSLVCAYLLAFYWNLDKPFWAGFAVFTVSFPTIGQSLQKGLLRTLGTLLGAGVGLSFFVLFPQDRLTLLLVLSLYLAMMMYFMAGSTQHGYFFFISAIVTMVIVLMASPTPQEAFYLAVYRTEETLLGICVYTVMTVLIKPRSAVDAFYNNVDVLMQAHADLFSLSLSPKENHAQHLMYKKYAEIKELLNTLETMLPAVKLESYTVYRNRAFWQSAMACGNELAALQREWSGTLYALHVLDCERLFPGFADKADFLRKCVTLLKDETQDFWGNIPDLQTDKNIFSGLEPAEQSLATAAQALYVRQVHLCRRMHELVCYLVHGGKSPSASVFLCRTSASVNPEQSSVMIRMFVLFWCTAFIWILLSPPGVMNTSFFELGVLMGMIMFIAGTGNPLLPTLYFAGGSLFSGLLYLYVYPIISSLFVFMSLMFLVALGMSFSFHRKDQTAMRLGFMLPWLSLGNFTNVPTYSVLHFITGSFILIFCMSITSILLYVLFSSNHSVRFMKKQQAFFSAIEALFRFLLNTHKPSWLHSLYIRYKVYTILFLSGEVIQSAKVCPPNFMDSETAMLLGTEAAGIANYVRQLPALYTALPADKSLTGLVAMTAPAMGGGKGTWGTSDLGIPDAEAIAGAVDNVQNMTKVFLSDLPSCAWDSSCGTGEDSVPLAPAVHAATVVYGSLIRSLTAYSLVIRSATIAVEA